MTFAQPFSGYEILAKIGSGAMGTVFKARQNQMGRIVALKVLRPSLARNERFVDRLRREARIVGSLNHPNIVAGFDLGEEGGYHFFVMEFVAGSSLKDLLTEWGMFPEEQVLDVAIQVTEALDHAYQHGVIHRDIKPGNILIDGANLVKLSDMGLAKGPTDLTLTRDGATIGTPQYISPEQARNPQDVDVRSDLYSLGATIFHMATGSPPFRGESIGDLIAKVLSEREPWAREVNPLLSEGLNLVIRKLLAKDLDLRYQNPAELLSDLRRVQSDEQPEVDPRLLDGLGRRGRPWYLLGGLSAALALALVLLWTFWPRTAASSPREDSNQKFRASLRQEVAQAGGYREKFAVIDRFAARAVGMQQKRMTEEKRADSSMNLSQELKRYIDSYLDKDRLAWLEAPANWRETEARSSEALRDAIAARFGYRLADLPALSRATLDPAVRSLERRVGDLAVQRDRRYLQDYLAYLQNDLEPAVDRLLDVKDFVGASHELDEMLGSYHGREGRPALAQLPEDLLHLVNEETRVRGERMRRRIILRQGALAKRMLEEIGDDLAKMRARLNGEADLLRLLRDFEGFAAEVVQHYPAADAFTRDVVDPWDEINDKLRRLDRDIHREVRVLEQDLLAEDLSQAYRSLLVEGEAGATIDLLRNRSIGEDDSQQERRLHIDLLADSISVRVLVLKTLLGGHEVVDLHQRGGSKIRLRSLPDGRFDLNRESPEGDRPVHLVNMDMARILQLAGEGFERDVEAKGLGAGLAFWKFVGGVQRNRALGSLPEMELRRFFSDVLRPMVDEIRGQFSDSESSAATALTRLRQAVDHSDLTSAQRGLQEFDSSFAETQVARRNRRNLRQLRKWVEIEGQRVSSESSYRQIAPRGALVHVDDDLRLELDYSRKWILAGELPEGWLRGRDHIRYAEPPRGLTEAAARMLSLPLLISGDRSYQLTLKWRVPPGDLEPQMLIFAVGDIHTAIALLPAAGKAFAILRSSPVADAREELVAGLRHELQGFESSPEAVVEGGIHRLLLRFDVRRARVFVRVEFEGQELAAGDFNAGAQKNLALGLAALQEFSLYGVQLREL